MPENIEPVSRLINQFKKLPGVGGKTAQRYAYGIIRMSESEAKEFTAAILSARERVAYCNECGNFTDASENPCRLCRTRDAKIICVVAQPKDVLAMEKARGFTGVYHVLHGTLSPLDNRGPDDIRLKELVLRVSKGGVEEIIMATNPDVEGEATAAYAAKLLKPLGVKVSRIAQGVSMGSEIEYADAVTLSRAIEDRKPL